MNFHLKIKFRFIIDLGSIERFGTIGFDALSQKIDVKTSDTGTVPSGAHTAIDERGVLLQFWS